MKNAMAARMAAVAEAEARTTRKGVVVVWMRLRFLAAVAGK